MTATILVTGATGKLGQRVVSRLLQKEAKVRVLTRRGEDALKLWGDRVDISEGNFSDLASLKEASRATDTVFLLSPIGETLAADQKAVIDAALSASVSRIVKISGSDWTIANAARSISGAAHAEVEKHLAGSGIAHTVLRPNAWMQVALEPVVAALRQGEDVPTRFGDAAVSFIDADDIADVAVHALTASKSVSGALVLTGGEALTALEIARIAARILHRPVGISHHSASVFPPHIGAFEQTAIGEFGQLIREGLAASVNDNIERITGRLPRSVEAYLRARLAATTPQGNHSEGEKTWR
ncbi:NmrA family NAD(P)-binding protein [Agrobacterium tumefaciens]|uniref:NmrA family NAD(P)-binding protein n=1 Tax=Agrobacterium tumefaciens TaxID=358 RepID=A0AA44F4G2_AGRTU|nr:NmrA family NAD(P)-binding protein [Agrobacterium tumefaciens]NSL20770.1 NmrA family NAD(P)-binding protein [Agrobacterium tumefaciens]NTB85233.1 NmrA family NAD(P)-binding protein [Agrobacterium tumefaciens]NTC16859.1 NmrA family NAD(P)-binding protein [Agrobacterium tumefaciens]NTC28283.1 NmrA family NAD(P)-binding protein [Agrobacterium tumefaciens]NTC55133.1 NmrA family NAD(P)-binding protein [Agrobacterium tumefaciens]